MLVDSMGDSEVGVRGVAAPPVRERTVYWNGVTKQTSHLGQLTRHNPVELLVLLDNQAGGGWVVGGWGGGGWGGVDWFETCYVTTNRGW